MPRCGVPRPSQSDNPRSPDGMAAAFRLLKTAALPLP